MRLLLSLAPSFRLLVLLGAFSAVSPLTGPLRADSPQAVSPPAAVPGIVEQKPAEGPFVEVPGGFMVPYTEKIPGSDVTIEMIPVPGGKFEFGSPDDEEGRGEDEGPQVAIQVDPMWVGKTEVTWAQYEEYMNLYAVFKEFESAGKRVVNDDNRVDAITAPTELYDSTFTYEYGDDPQQPAVTMTQYAAQQFTKWLSKVTGEQYRLPTEAEWEYAARGGTSTAYSWGDDPAEIEDYAWHFENAFDGPSVVGAKKPNPFGLHDMHGNAAEWTVNEYTEDGYAWLEALDSPVSAVAAVKWPETPWPCVARGGSWESEPEQVRSASRLASDDEAWKSEDPNFPRSPWWFTSDPARGVGFRLFRSYQPLDGETITKFWEANAEETRMDVESRVTDGRGGYGLVDPSLPEAISELEGSR